MSLFHVGSKVRSHLNVISIHFTGNWHTFSGIEISLCIYRIGFKFCELWLKFAAVGPEGCKLATKHNKRSRMDEALVLVFYTLIFKLYNGMQKQTYSGLNW